ncbi:MAG: N-6 DNA methylase [Actinomycetota bacterium]
MTAAAERRWAVEVNERLAAEPIGVRTAVVADLVATALDAPSPVAEVAPELRPAGADGAADPDRVDRWRRGLPPPPGEGGWAEPRLMGHVHEQAATPDDRRARGAWYTPTSVVRGLTSAALTLHAEAAHTPLPRRVVDPTCGGGAFLLAALDALVDRGLDPVDAVGRVHGLDLDPTAVAVSRCSVALWVATHRHLDDAARALALAAIDVRRGDALVDLPEGWTGSETLVLGNPPFASPLKAGAMPERATAHRLERAELLGPYADLGAVHLQQVVERVGDGSTVALVLPQSVLAARDTEGLRRWCDEHGRLLGLWAAREALFDAGVRPCAPVIHRPATPEGGTAAPADETGGSTDSSSSGPTDLSPTDPSSSGPTDLSPTDRAGDRPTVRVFGGPDVAQQGARAHDRWGPLAADALGAPSLPPIGPDTLASFATGTAGFRDEHYALVEACREWEVADGEPTPGGPVARIATVGSVDPLQFDWGRRRYTFGGERRLRPVADRDRLPAKVQRWHDRVRRPKILLATQAKLLEPAIDRHGVTVPATPLVAVLAEPEDLDRVAAVLLAPPVVLWAWRRWFGSALSVDAVKLAARQVGELPLPVDAAAWDEAAAMVATADSLEPPAAWDRVTAVAQVMNAAYGADDEVLAWWRARRKARPTAGIDGDPTGPDSGADPAEGDGIDRGHSGAMA